MASNSALGTSNGQTIRELTEKEKLKERQHLTNKIEGENKILFMYMWFHFQCVPFKSKQIEFEM